VWLGRSHCEVPEHDERAGRKCAFSQSCTQTSRGHVRAGLEDNVYYRKGELATGNAQLIERLVRLSHEFGREVASVAETRAMLGLRSINALEPA
jgi:uncharacterized protein (DUF849 family)